MGKCYFCNQETEGKQFNIKNNDTNEINKAEVCNNCDAPDLHKE